MQNSLKRVEKSNSYSKNPFLESKTKSIDSNAESLRRRSKWKTNEESMRSQWGVNWENEESNEESNESMRSQMSQRGVKWGVNWVNKESNEESNESMSSRMSIQTSLWGVKWGVKRVNEESSIINHYQWNQWNQSMKLYITMTIVLVNNGWHWFTF